jgi:hypothetical protein
MDNTVLPSYDGGTAGSSSVSPTAAGDLRDDSLLADLEATRT